MMGYAGMAYPPSAAAYQMAAYQQAAASAAASQQAAAVAAYQQPPPAQESYQAAGAAAYGGYAMPAQQQPAQQPVDEAVGQEAHIQVSGCTHATVGPIVRGNFTLNGQNHGKPTYKKDSQVNGLDVQLYFWDERDGPNFCGWWFGPKVGGDQVWAYHPSKVATPPKSGWKVPYDGPIDTTFALSAVTVQSYGAYGQQAAPAYGQPAQQALTYGQQPSAYGQPAQPAQPSWQQAQQEYQQQQYQQQQQQQQAEQQRKQQLEQQRQMQILEAQKKQQEELRKRQQQEELRLRMEQAQKMRQEELRRQADLQRKQQEETKAAMKIRTVLQKLRLVTPETFAIVEKEMQAIKMKELPNCGSQASQVADECVKAAEVARISVESILSQRRQDEENRLEGLRKHKELQEKALALLQELEGLMVLAEESFTGLKTSASPLLEDPALPLEKVEKIKDEVELAAKKTQEKIETVQKFFITNGPLIKVPDMAGMAPCDNKQIQQKLTQRLTETIRSKDALIKSIEVAKSKAIKRGEALAKLTAIKAKFQTYCGKKDSLDKPGVKKYAKGEFKIDLSPQALDQIWKYVVGEGNQGIKADQHQRLKVAVGIARELEQDEQRKKARLELEKQLEDKKIALKEELDEVNKGVDELEEAIVKAETASQSFQKKDPSAPAPSTAEIISACEEIEAMVKAAREQTVAATKSLKNIGAEDELQPELKVWLNDQAKPTAARLSRCEPRLFRVINITSRTRMEAKKKEADLLAALERRALAAIKYHQTAKKLSNKELFAAFVGKGSAIKEATWLTFFKKAEKKPKPEDESTDAKPEEELTQEELKRVYATLDDEKTGAVSIEQFKTFIGSYLKVVKETVLQVEEDAGSESRRKLEVGEVLELLGEATPSTGDLVRANVKALKDDVEGWVTISGNQGGVFLIPGGNLFKVVKETFLTSSFELEAEEEGKPPSERKLRLGEQLLVRQFAKKDEKSGALRLKGKAKLDGAIGWATVSDASTVFLQAL